MDKLAAALGLDPVELRCRNAMTEGAQAPTGQVIDSAGAGRRDCCAGCRPCRCRRRAARTAMPSTCGTCPAAWPTPPTARAWCAASATRWHTRTSASPRASTTTPPPGCGSRCVGGEPVGDGAHRGGRGRPGPGHRRAADRPHRARRRPGHHRARPTPRSAAPARRRRPGRPTSPAARSRPPARRCASALLAGVQHRLGRTVPDLRLEGGKVVSDGRGQSSASWPTSWATRSIDETVEWRHRPTEPLDPETGQGYRARAVRVRRAPRGRRRGHRARPGQGRRAGLRPGRRQGDQPAGGASGRSRAASAQGLGLAVMEEIQVDRRQGHATRRSPTT